MKIIHGIATSPESEFYRAITALGISFEDSKYTSILNITEDHAKWPRVNQLMHEFKISATVQNIFTKNEILEAEWLKTEAIGHFGYPQPEDDYKEITYDSNSFCPSCGIGKIQKAPFRLRSEPKKSRSAFLQLNWVFDELFVTSEVKTAFEMNDINGLNYENPVLNKSNTPICSIHQMKICNIQNPCLITHDLKPVTCKLINEEFNPASDIFLGKRETFCGKVKYSASKRGPFQFHRNNFNCSYDIIKSFEWFGSGARAFQMLIISRKTAAIILKNKWRGVSLSPIELVD